MAMLSSRPVAVPFMDGSFPTKTALTFEDISIQPNSQIRPFRDSFFSGNSSSFRSTDNGNTSSSIPRCLQIQRPARTDAQGQSSQNTNNDTQCLLLDLPKHIRGRIYRFVLFPNPTKATPDFPLSRNRRGYHVNDTSAPYQPPALLSVNRQVREEASEIFYTEAKFWMSVSYHQPREEMRMFQRWRASLRAQDRKRMRRFRIEFFQGAVRMTDAKVWVKKIGWSLEDSIGGKVELRVQLGAHRIVFGSVASTMDDIRGD